MNKQLLIIAGALAFSAAAWAAETPQATPDNTLAPVVKLTVEPGHPWTPPFGLERVGRPWEAVVEVRARFKPEDQYTVVEYRAGRETTRHALSFPDGRWTRVALTDWPDETALLVKSAEGAQPVEVARAKVVVPAFEAEALARPDEIINPVDLGAIQPPADWLLLAREQKGSVEIAALTRTADTPEAKVVAWFESAPDRKVSAALPLKRNVKAQLSLALPPCPETAEKDLLHVVLVETGGRELWRKAIQTMIVQKLPKWPVFGAVETKLRYDRPILNVDQGKYTWLDYKKAWDSALSDVVAFFPNGARWVFWRGSNYCPFWAARFNTGVNYQWAERHPDKRDDLSWSEMCWDNELRFGRVAIVASTAARVHIRWSYRTSNFKHQPAQDSITEDFYFYPDSFGTRVVTIKRLPGTRYDFEEYVIISPQAAYPLDFAPGVEALSFDGKTMAINFPPRKYTTRLATNPIEIQDEWTRMGQNPLIYRIHPDRWESLSAVCFCPQLKAKPNFQFLPFYERGARVTPTYWGSHWPLTRGLDTGWSISDRISVAPSSNSLLGFPNPQPLRTAKLEEKDEAGTVVPMEQGTYVWLIGMTAADDDKLRHMAMSYAKPPKIEAKGATLAAAADFAYAQQERRAFCLTVNPGSKSVELKLTPDGWCVNPVFELENAPKKLKHISLDGRELDSKRYAWDGKTLWLEASLSAPAELQLQY